MADCEKILIAGFAGAGKSSFLRELKRSAPDNWRRLDDLDDLIFLNHGKGRSSLANCIEDWGWEKFRALEEQELEKWVETPGKGVLALGGGSLNEENFAGLCEKARIFLLEVNFETAWYRVSQDQERPLAQKGENYMRFLFEKRQKVFARIPWKMTNSDETDLKALARAFWQGIP